MGVVGAGYSISLDGFVAGPGDDFRRLFAWMTAGDTEFTVSTGEHDIDLKMSAESAGEYQEMASTVGAIVSGRRLFNVAGAWGGKHPMNVPVVVLTHHVPQEWVKEGSPFTFVTDGIENAISKAKEIAGDKNVGVGGADVTRQCIKAGLLDELQLDLVPVLLGSGIRLFEQLGIEPVELVCTKVSSAPGVTHLHFRFVK